jgi:hypothetical protein
MTKELENGYDETEVQRRVQDEVVRLKTGGGVEVALMARDLGVATNVFRRIEVPLDL